MFKYRFDLRSEVKENPVHQCPTCFDFIKATDVEAVFKHVQDEVERVQGNGSPMTDFGLGVIAACKDIENYLERLR